MVDETTTPEVPAIVKDVRDFLITVKDLKIPEGVVRDSVLPDLKTDRAGSTIENGLRPVLIALAGFIEKAHPALSNMPLVKRLRNNDGKGDITEALSDIGAYNPSSKDAQGIHQQSAGLIDALTVDGRPLLRQVNIVINPLEEKSKSDNIVSDASDDPDHPMKRRDAMKRGRQPPKISDEDIRRSARGDRPDEWVERQYLRGQARSDSDHRRPTERYLHEEAAAYDNVGGYHRASDAEIRESAGYEDQHTQQRTPGPKEMAAYAVLASAVSDAFDKTLATRLNMQVDVPSRA